MIDASPHRTEVDQHEEAMVAWEHFARLSQSLSTLGTRRGLVRGLAVGALGTSFAADTAEAGRSRRKQRSKKKKKQLRRQNGSNEEAPAPGAQNCTVCEDADDCPFTSIQAAINAATAGNTIIICEGQYKEDFTISKDLTLIAQNDDVLLKGTGNSSVVTVPSGVTATMQGVWITGGTGTAAFGTRVGGGIFNFGTLTLIDAALFDNNVGDGGWGGAIASFGPVTLDNVAINDNAAGDQGGGIYIERALDIRNGSRIADNKADRGGGIYHNGGVITISGRSTIAENVADSDGGGIYNISGQIIIDNSLVRKNKAKDNGGGILNHLDVTMQNGAVIEENEAQNGGGVYNLGPDIPGFVRPTLTMIDSAISRNEADDLGGGILNDNGIVTLQNSTVFANDANDLGGGIFNTDGGTVTLDALSGVGGNKPNNCTGTTACAA